MKQVLIICVVMATCSLKIHAALPGKPLHSKEEKAEKPVPPSLALHTPSAPTQNNPYLTKFVIVSPCTIVTIGILAFTAQLITTQNELNKYG